MPSLLFSSFRLRHFCVQGAENGIGDALLVIDGLARTGVGNNGSAYQRHVMSKIDDDAVFRIVYTLRSRLGSGRKPLPETGHFTKLKGAPLMVDPTLSRRFGSSSGDVSPSVENSMERYEPNFFLICVTIAVVIVGLILAAIYIPSSTGHSPNQYYRTEPRR